MLLADYGRISAGPAYGTTERWTLLSGQGSPFLRPLPTPIATPQGVTFVPPAEILPTAF